jgi:hypothetical protein
MLKRGEQTQFCRRRDGRLAEQHTRISRQLGRESSRRAHYEGGTTSMTRPASGIEPGQRDAAIFHLLHRTATNNTQQDDDGHRDDEH